MTNLLLSFPGTSGWLLTILFTGAAVYLWYTTLPGLLNREFKNPTWKLIWMIVVIVIPVFGALLYRAWS